MKPQSPFKRKTYILPTKFGLAFLVMTLVLFFMAVGYANNLIYIFVFFLISISLTGIVVTNRNVDKAFVVAVFPESNFAMENAIVNVEIENMGSRPLWDLQLSFADSEEEYFIRKIEPHMRVMAEVPWRPKTRGLKQLPVMTLKSTFPFGLLKSWQKYRLNQTVLIFPQKVGSRAFPPEARDDERMQPVGLFKEHRLYQSSDSPTRIDWRATARRQEMLVKNYEEAEKEKLHFDFAQTSQLTNLEEKLSQLTVWIDEAEKSNHSYSLKVHDFVLPSGRGPGHHFNCLEHLAMVEEADLDG